MSKFDINLKKRQHSSSVLCRYILSTDILIFLKLFVGITEVLLVHLSCFGVNAERQSYQFFSLLSIDHSPL